MYFLKATWNFRFLWFVDRVEADKVDVNGNEDRESEVGFVVEIDDKQV
jgi:hypothetical protein